MTDLTITGAEHIFGRDTHTIKFGEFEFLESDFAANPILMLGIVIAADPTPGQKEMMELSGMIIKDKNGKQFFPREEDSGVTEEND